MSPSFLDRCKPRLHDKDLVILPLIVAAMISLGCGGMSASGTPVPSAQTHLSISISPNSVVLASGSQQQFTAMVRNTSKSAVVWSASAGTITGGGLFIAPVVTSKTLVKVSATSVADKSSTAVSILTIEPDQPLHITTHEMPGGMVGVPYALTLAANGGLPPYRWRLDGFLPQGLSFNAASGTISGIPTKMGSFPVQVAVSDAIPSVATQSMALSMGAASSGNYDGPAELPRVYVQTALVDTPAPGSVVPVPAGGDLQAALDNVNCGDTIELQAGATFKGGFHLRAKACDDQHWIIIRSNTPDGSLPPEGTRMTPCYAGVASLPGRPTFNCSSPTKVLAQIMGKPPMSPISPDSGANHYRLMALEITRPVGSGLTQALIQPGGTVDHIILDRVWLHGTAQDDTARGIYLDGVTNAAVVDSYLNDFHCTSVTGSCTDAQDIVGGNGSNAGGPYKVVNNFLEAAAENIMFGGGGITTINPTDIEIRHNHLFKPMLWMPGEPGFVGGVSGKPFIVKNHFELKNAVRVLFEGNVLENTWGGFSQAGYSILLTPRSHASRSSGINQCPVCQVTDVTIRYNTISHVGAGVELANPLNGIAKVQSLNGERYSIHDITIDDINSSKYKGAGVLAMVFNGWSTHVLNSISIEHVTAFPDRSLLFLVNLTSNPTMSNFSFTNNLVSVGPFPVWSGGGGPTNCAASDQPALSLSTCFSNLTFTNNALMAASSAFGPSKWPPQNLFLADAAAAGFTDARNGNYQLLPTSPYINAGTDGKPLGADIVAINAAIAGVY
jgi:hypothetical protein